MLVEAGHRCAIPTCRQHPVDIAHIVPRKNDGSNDVFDNLIALCTLCHRRHHQGEIDRPALRQYKANLSVLNHRYGDLERRVLQFFADQPDVEVVQFPGGWGILLQYLMDDGLLQQVDVGGVQVAILDQPVHEFFAITEKGRAFIDRWLEALDLEAT